MRSAYVGGADARGVRVVEAVTHDLRMGELAVRHAVFVLEQHVPLVLEVDARDFRPDVVHLVALGPDGHVIGTARIIPEATRNHHHLGRLAVRAPWRGRGVGAMLVASAHDYLLGVDPVGAVVVTLDAQVGAIGFYRALGYAPTTGDVFLDAGIEHVTMSTRLAPGGPH